MAAYPRPLGYISIGVRDYAVLKTFYTAVLALLGLHLVYDSGSNSKSPRTLGFGPDANHEIIDLFEHGGDAQAPGRGCHIAFNAVSRRAVNAFHNAAVLHGGRSDRAPGLRLHYGPRYFAAFVVCLDGWRLEAVCQAEADGSGE